MFKQVNFWVKYARYLLILLCSVAILIAGQQISFIERGPKLILADQETGDVGEPNNGYDTGIEPITEPAPVTPETSAPVSQPAAPVPSCSDDVRYCDTNVNRMIHKTGGYYDPNHSLRDGQGCVYAFVQEEACNQSAPAVPAQPVASAPVVSAPPAPARVCEPNSFDAGSCSRCAADGTFRGSNGSDFGSNNGSAEWCSCAQRYNQSAYNQYCQVATPPQQPKAPSCPGDHKQCPDGSVVSRNPGDGCNFYACPNVYVPVACTSNNSCSAPAPSCGSVTSGVDNCGNRCTRTGSACVNRTSPPGAVSVPVTITNTNNPVNTVTNTVTNTNTATATNTVTLPGTNTITNREVVREVHTFGNVGVGTSSATPVYYANVKQLPKTGLPLLAWAAGAFIPAGFGLRRFKSIKKEMDAHPSYLWEDRQYKSGS